MIGFYQYVFWLQVTMNLSSAMQGFQSKQHMSGNFRIIHFSAALCKIQQITTWTKLHDNIWITRQETMRKRVNKIFTIYATCLEFHIETGNQ